MAASFCSAATVSVSNFGALTSALNSAKPGDTVLLQDGTYKIQKTWAIQITTDNLTIRSKSGKRERVIIEGMGMNARRHHGFFVRANGVTIADLTIQNVRNHCVQTAPGVDRLHIRNCILRNAGEQIVKVTTGKKNDPSENGIIENCLFEYSAGIGPRYYIGGIDVHNGKNWIVRDNIFRFIRSPGKKIAEYAIHFWANSANTLVERNLIINCDRGIGFGLGNRGHLGGIIRNNMIYHDDSKGFNDVGIGLESSPGTRVYNNTIFLEHNYPRAIECRFPATKDVLIENNLTNKSIQMRNGATATINDNIIDADAGMFVDASSGNLHISAKGINYVIDKGREIDGLINDFDNERRPNGIGIDIGADEIYSENQRVN